jgi:AcrR family transcriptional regulator
LRKQRDGDETKERVLSAAQKLFADKGFSGTSLAMISQECGISEGLILHHYQSKKNLYRQVLESLADSYAQELAVVTQSTGNLEEMLQQSLLALFEFWKRDSTYDRISLWAYLEKQEELVNKEAEITAGLARAVEELQKMGVIDARVHPIVFLTTVIGPIHFWNRYREQYQATLDLPGALDELDHLFINQFTGLVNEMFFKQKEKGNERHNE